MERDDSYKQELFEKFPGEVLKPQRNKLVSNSPSNFSVKLTPENLLFIVIGFILVIAVSFSLGVEKGKKIRYKSRAKISKAVPEVQKKITRDTVIQQVTEPRQVATKQAPKPVVKAEQAPQKKISYTIQVVTYMKPDFAKKEMAFLEQKGYKSSLKRSSGFYVICVGSYDSKEEAISSLKKLRKRYKDCFVKKTII